MTVMQKMIAKKEKKKNKKKKKMKMSSFKVKEATKKKR